MIGSAEEFSQHMTSMVLAYANGDSRGVVRELKVLSSTIGDAQRFLCIMAETVAETIREMLPPEVLASPTAFAGLSVLDGTGRQAPHDDPATWAGRLVIAAVNDELALVRSEAEIIVERDDGGELFFAVFAVLLPKVTEIALGEVGTVFYQTPEMN